MKDVARTKLGLPMNTPISLEQIRDGKPIDLEDGESGVPNISTSLAYGSL